MAVGGGAQIAPHAFGDPRQDQSARPAEQPGQYRCAEEAAEVQADQRPVDGLPVLEGDQHVVHQRHGQIRRHQLRCGGEQGQRESEQQLPAVGAGKTPETEKRPGGWRDIAFPAAGRAFVQIGGDWRVASGAHFFWRARGCIALQREFANEAQGGQIVFQGVAPDRKALPVVEQFQCADSGVVMVGQAQVWRQRPAANLPICRDGMQLPTADSEQSRGKMQAVIEIRDQVGLEGVVCGQTRGKQGSPLLGERGGWPVFGTGNGVHGSGGWGKGAFARRVP